MCSRLTAKEESNGSSFPVIESGCYLANCVQIIDLGYQYNQTFDSFADKVMITWELPDELITVKIDDEEKEVPRFISKEYTNSLSEKANLRKDLESWRGKAFTEKELEGFDLKQLLSKPCQLQIVNGISKTSNKKYAKISAITSLPRGTKGLPLISDCLAFEITKEGIKELSKLPKWIQEKIKQSETYKDLMQNIDFDDVAPEASIEDYEEEMPF